ncbi:YdcF family protein [Acidicapsa ligni]|uniref:YdcF family protein n=1 Tax=Acidicapsa ligni TaxID=542300 RepID=UPI0021E004E8|nr:YdcF family protein [Acidicapsa ligni]
MAVSKQITRQKAHRKPVLYRGKGPRRRRSISLRLRVFLGCGSLLGALLVWAIVARSIAPMANSTRKDFDAIIVLGTPADSDGNPTPEQQARITEGVHEYERGVAPRLIMTGGAAHNRFVEAEVMARIAHAQGVPSSAILQETQAQDTIQNACYSRQILHAHGWHSAEVVSSASHLPRASMIFSYLPGEKLEWRMHAASDSLVPAFYSDAAEVVETIKTARYLIWARWLESCTP